MDGEDRGQRLQELRVARQRERQAAQRRAAQRAERRRQALGAVAGFALVGLLAAGGLAVLRSSSGEARPRATPSPAPSGCDVDRTTAPGPGVPGPDQDPGTTATVQTTLGTVELDLDADEAPCATRSFAYLADHGYYDGKPCTRLTTGPLHFLQCGDPLHDDAGYVYAEEGDQTSQLLPRGTVAMVSRGPGTTSASFFVVLADTDLPVRVTRLGTVRAGLAVLDRVAAAGSVPDVDGRPVLPVSLRRITVHT